MKRFLLSLGLLSAITVSAQLPSGTTAPDFSLTDLNGNSYVLSDILDDGKAVYLDISATWCPPCWSVHEAHILDEIYYTYGPGGSDEIAVLFVEGDSSTTMDDLYGTGPNTQGDWVTGVPYPIINDDTFISTYTIDGWPTFYTICPDGTLNRYDQTTQGAYLTVDSVADYFAQNCNMSLTGAANHVKVNAPDLFYLCGDGDSDIAATFKNYGNNDVTSAEFDLLEDGNVIATQSFSGTVNPFSSENILFDDIALNTTSTYKIQLTSVNGGAPYSSDAEMIEGQLHFETAEQASTNEVQILVTTDIWPSEISWDLTDSNGNVLASDSYSGPDQTGPDVNQTFTYDVVLPESADCYTINYYDSYGDGWAYNENAGIEVVADGVVIYSEQVGNFGSELNRFNAFGAGVLSVNDLTADTKFSVYPNPTTGVVNIRSTQASDITVTDMTGKTVASYKDVDTNATLDLSHLAKGVYILQSNGDDHKEVKKLIIK